VSEADNVLFGRAELERPSARLVSASSAEASWQTYFIVAGVTIAWLTTLPASLAMFKPHGIVHGEAMQVATDLGLPRWWLNEQASTYISGKQDADKRRVFDHPGLRVMAVSPRHIFAMKAFAVRRVTLMMLARSPASSEWSQPTRPCR
jgi:hypothetical protein